VQSGPIGKILLGQPEAPSQFSDASPERRPQIVHVGIVPTKAFQHP
jgi:hypothetical protein